MTEKPLVERSAHSRRLVLELIRNQLLGELERDGWQTLDKSGQFVTVHMSPVDRARVGKELAAIVRELDGLPDPSVAGSRVDELMARRADRAAAAKKKPAKKRAAKPKQKETGK